MKTIKAVKNDSCKLNRFKISLQDCIEVEVESEELILNRCILKKEKWIWSLCINQVLLSDLKVYIRS